MKIALRLILGFLSVAVIVAVVGYISSNASQRTLQKTIGDSSVQSAIKTLSDIDRNYHLKIERFQEYTTEDLILQEALLKSNQMFERLDNIQAYINEKDLEWTAVLNEKATPFMLDLINNKLSDELRKIKEFYEEEYGYRVFGEIFVTNKYGANIAQTGKTSDYYQADEDWWQSAKRNGQYIRDVEYDESADVYSTDIGIRIDDEDGNFLGNMKVVFDIEDASNITKEAWETSKYKNVYFKLITRNGRIIFSTERGIKIHANKRYELFPLIKDIDDNGHFIIKGDQQGNADIFITHTHSRGYKDYQGLGWILVVEYLAEEIFAPVNKLRKIVLIISLSATAFAILLGIFISSSISNPIVRLKDATVEVSKGRLDTKIKTSSRDEIGTLANSFNNMLEDLKKTTVSRDYVDNIINSMTETLIVVTPEFRIQMVNRATCEILGYKENDLLNQSIGMIFTEEELLFKKSGISDLIKSVSVTNAEKVYLSKDGREIPVLFSGAVMSSDDGKIQGIVCIGVDITERKKIEEKLRVAHKMSSVGRLTASVFHEILNPVNIISAHTQLLLMDAEKDSTTEKDLKAIQGEIERIVDITDALLKFSRGKKLVVEEIEVNDLLENTLSVIKPEMNLKSIKLIIKFEKELPNVMAHGGELGEVFLDIITNAFDAMPEGGTLTVKTRSTRPPANRTGSTNSELKGDFVEISFEDTGCGILKKDIDKVFEPFFSTKKEIKGVGLGLSTSYAIIESYGGTISVESEEGKGATFTIDLPAKT